MPGNRVLHEHPLLLRIQKVRERLYGSDRTDHLEETIKWENRAKKALILMNAKGHEGFQILLEQAKKEIQERNRSLKERRPEDMSPDGMHKYTTERAMDFLALDLWAWFLSIFMDAETEIKDLENILASEEAPEEDEYRGSDSPTSETGEN